MKLWGWWRKDVVKNGNTEAKPEDRILLEDIPPPFKDSKKLDFGKLPSLSQTIGQIGVEDFKNMPQMPCFRNAILTGFGMGVTVSAVIFASKRVVSRATNWGVGGFLVGSVVAWEQCRFRMYRSRRNVQLAKQYRNVSKETAETNERIK